jgi:hypothetical protein
LQAVQIHSANGVKLHHELYDFKAITFLHNVLQLWRVAANILNKQPRTNDKGVVLQLGGWAWGYKLFSIKNKFVTKNAIEPQTWTESLTSYIYIYTHTHTHKTLKIIAQKIKVK